MTKVTRAAASVAALLLMATAAAAADEQGWVEKSNENAQIVLELLAEFSPEGAASLGVDGVDEAIIDYRPGLYARNRSASEAVLAELRERQAKETEPRVHQDLEILVQAVEDSLRSAALSRDNLLPYYNVSQTVFRGVRALVEPQVPDGGGVVQRLGGRQPVPVDEPVPGVRVDGEIADVA